MIKTMNLPKEAIDGTIVMKSLLEGIDGIQFLLIDRHTSIKRHGHDENQWEVVFNLSNKTGWICLKGEQHEVKNMSSEPVKLMTVKGQSEQSYDDLASFFYDVGFSIHHGSLIIQD